MKDFHYDESEGDNHDDDDVENDDDNDDNNGDNMYDNKQVEDRKLWLTYSCGGGDDVTTTKSTKICR